jgi:MoaA/NifB/PqqE/SkfB family radical SAM enzyme
MKPKDRKHACVDEEGRLIVVPEVASEYGLEPGTQIPIDRKATGFSLHPSINRLGKVYIEPTNRCNLDCRTCMRNDWNETLGLMKKGTFHAIVEDLKGFTPAPSVFFGGLGEPLLHPDIVDMVAHAKTFSPWVELITNGTLLSLDMSKKLMDAGLDMLWMSLDGATPESYADVRLGAELPNVMKNLAAFHRERLSRNMGPDCTCSEGYNFYSRPLIGLVFVAMKRNINDLPKLIDICSRYAVSRFMVSNVLPYSDEMRGETLYSRTIMETPPPTRIELPRMDISDLTKKALSHAVRTGFNVTVGGADTLDASNHCPFISAGATAIGWDGQVSPCLPLLHSHVRYVNDRTHSCRCYHVGTVNDRSFRDLWHEPDYVAFRARVREFEFSPCTICGGCDFSEDNETDCLGNPFPTCGTCPWAQGIVQCP